VGGGPQDRLPVERAMMRLGFILCCLTLCGCAAPKPLPIAHTDNGPVIDGLLTDACWETARPLRVMHPHDHQRRPPAQPPMIARAVWDADYLYLAYEVTDTSLVALGTGRESGPPNNRRPQAVEWAPEKNLDLVEFFIADNPRFFWEIHHNAANHLNTLWIELPTAAQLKTIPKPGYTHIKFHRERFLPDAGTRTVQRATRLQPRTTLNRPADRDTGFTGELRLPWNSLFPNQPAPKPGRQFSLLAVCLNGNGGKTVYHSNGKDLPALMFHYSVAQWPVFELSAIVHRVREEVP
jgi:hypothetical protein